MTAAKKFETKAPETGNRATIIRLNPSMKKDECVGCEGYLTCEGAYLGCRACVTMPELFVSQR